MEDPVALQKIMMCLLLFAKHCASFGAQKRAALPLVSAGQGEFSTMFIYSNVYVVKY